MYTASPALFLGIQSPAQKRIASIFAPRKGNEAPLWDLSVINPHRANEFRSTAKAVLNPNTKTVVRHQSEMKFASFSPHVLLENRMHVKPIVQPVAREMVRVEFHVRSIPGTVRGNPKPRKDAIIADSEGLIHIFGVCDSHGIIGSEIAKFVANKLPKRLRALLSESPISENLFIGLFREIQSSIRARFSLASDTSGCRCVVTVIQDNVIWCAHVGDCRAMVARRYQTAWIGLPLSMDHTPNRLFEVERIVGKGGRVEPMRNQLNEPMGMPLVWAKEKDVPGLTVTRSLGDWKCHEVGVLADPEVKSFPIIPEDRMLILGSDGLWSMLDEQEVADIVRRFAHLGVVRDCCSQVLDAALARWAGKGEAIDDISVIVVFLLYINGENSRKNSLDPDVRAFSQAEVHWTCETCADCCVSLSASAQDIDNLPSRPTRRLRPSSHLQSRCGDRSSAAPRPASPARPGCEIIRPGVPFE